MAQTFADAYRQHVAYWAATYEDGNLPDPDDAHERQHDGGDPATEALVDGVQWVEDDADDWDDDGPVW